MNCSGAILGGTDEAGLKMGFLGLGRFARKESMSAKTLPSSSWHSSRLGKLEACMRAARNGDGGDGGSSAADADTGDGDSSVLKSCIYCLTSNYESVDVRRYIAYRTVQ